MLQKLKNRLTRRTEGKTLGNRTEGLVLRTDKDARIIGLRCLNCDLDLEYDVDCCPECGRGG